MTAVKTTDQGPRVVSLGCRLNTYESEIMRGHARTTGLNNAIIVNTCAVTSEAERQGRQAIRRLRRENPNAHIIAAGCAVQLDPDRYADMTEVNRVLGNEHKMKAESFLPDLKTRSLVSDIMSVRDTSSHLVEGFDERTRAFVQVQQGCDHRCTFCIIPFARGNNRSVPIGRIAQEIQGLVDAGYKEVVITGVDITGYGADLPGAPTLGQMIRRVLAAVPDLPRLRLSSLDPAEVGDDLFQLIANESRVLPHFHISAQAGDDLILKRMKRRHLRTDILSFCERIRALRPDAVFGADLIAGFPTETEPMFQNTLRLIDDADLTYLHVFPYSVRPGTPAAAMPQIDGAVIKDRAARLRTKGKAALHAYMSSRVGVACDVLMERPQMGRCENFAPVWFESANEIGAIVRARIVDVKNEVLKGEVIA